MTRTHRTVLAAATVAAGLTFVAPRTAAAQIGAASPLPVRLKLGAFFPADGATRRETDGTHFSGEIDISVPFLRGAGSSYLSLGYSENFSGDRKLRTVPLSFTQTSAPPNPAEVLTGNLYYGSGVAAYFVRASGGEQPTGDKVLFGGFLLLGYQSPAKLFVEAKYHLVGGRVEGLRPNGLQVFVGTRL